MDYIVDTEGEELAKNRELDVVIPLDIRFFTSGKVEISGFSELEGFAEEFTTEFKDDMFSSSAIKYIREHMKPYMKKIGYREDPACRKFYYEYLLTALSDVNFSLILDGTAEYRGENLKNRTTFDLAAISEFGHAAFITCDGGKVVSIAATHSPVNEFDTIEIGTETAPKYRRRGLAASNVAALTRHLLLSGKQVAYSCSNENVASSRIAEAVGFRMVARRYYYVGRRN